MAVYTFNDNLQIFAPKHIDTRYINLFTPWGSTAAANAGIPMAYRYLGLTVLIGITEYWYQAGITDPDLVPKVGGVTSVTADNLLTETGANIQLGGTILHDTLLDITGTNFKLYINGDSNSVSPFIVSSTGTAPSMTVQNSNITGSISILSVVSTNGTAVRGNSGATGVSIYGFNNNNGIGGYFNATTAGGAGVSILANSTAQPLIVNSELQPSFFQVTTVSNAGVTPIIQLVRQSSTGGAPTVGIGGSIEFYNRMSNGSSQISNTFESSLTNVTTGSVDSKLIFRGVNASSQVDKFIISAPATIVYQTRFEEAMGAAVASANDLTLGVDGNLFSITGAVQINAITVLNWQAGSEVAFILASNPTLKHNTAGGGGTAPLFLAGGVDFVAAAGDYIAFKYDGSFWRETTRRQAGGGGAGLVSADNALNLSPTTTNVRLGGALVVPTTITSAGANYLTLSGTNTNSIPALLYILSNGFASTAINIQQTGTGGDGISSFTNSTGVSLRGVNSSNGVGVQGLTNTGTGLWSQSSGNGSTGLLVDSTGSGSKMFFSTLRPIADNTVVPVWESYRTVAGAGNPGVIGIGQSIDMYLFNDELFSNPSSILSNRITSTFTSVAVGTELSEFIISGRSNPAGFSDLLTLTGTGAARLNHYGVATFTGTPTYTLLVDASGNIIEGALSGGGTVITADNGLTISPIASNVELGGTLIQNTLIDGGAFTLSVGGSHAVNAALIVYNTVAGIALQANATSGVGAVISSNTGYALDVSISPASTNSADKVANFFRGSTGTPANGMGGYFSFQLESSTNTIREAARMEWDWIIATDATRYGKIVFSGAFNGASFPQWVTMSGDSLISHGTGVGIQALIGQTGIFTIGTNAGGVFESPIVPVQAANSSTSTNTIVLGLNLTRQGAAFNGAIGNGIKITMDGHDDGGSFATGADIRMKLTTVTSGAVVGELQFAPAITGSGGTPTVMMSVCGRNGGVVNELVVNYASNAAAITAGLSVGDHYRNGDNLCIVH